ncbi:hypothetical protein TSACC_2911 [Terrimicrobium sacchariphilum]|uniref:Uncharacterized protein n=1 Tax=Terrimicrobium sacchariphilum TaxID=690879 RepID=A0A146G529_TERSA|nr:hypothetical protein [Terrimicrobium sacchariphilum]GAT32512.1 hypothetical protein TSACC_2911 [Terrimicrobium sacchariphilum]
MKHREPPVFQIAEMYRAQATRLSFREELDGYLQHGYVFNTPAFFVMGRAVSRHASLEEIVDPWRVFAREEQDAWFLAALAGDWRSPLHLFPYSLPWIGWERGLKSGLRFWPLARVARYRA